MNLVAELHRQKVALVERCLVACIEVIEGRVPTVGEVIQHGRHYEYPDHNFETWTWKGSTIIALQWWPRPGVPFEISSLVNPFAEFKE